MPTLRRATWLFVSALSLSCRHRAGGADGIQVVDVDAPVGLDGPALSQCDGNGRGCAGISRGDSIAPASLVKSEPGARASLGPDAATVIDVAEDTAVFFPARGSLELRKGGVVIRRLGNSEPKSEPYRLEVAGRSGEIDPEVGATVVLRASSADRAGVTVEKGKLTLKADNGQTMVLLSGESAELFRGRPPERVASFFTVEPRRGPVAPPLVIAEDEPPRGLGRMTARVPGQNDVVSGVRLVSHHVEAVVRDGLARTEIEEEFHNDTSQVLEGRYVFPLPAEASISRLALYVNDKLVEGEIVEKKRAATIFRNIVDDTVRRRDPALLEWVSGGDFSLKIFPLPPKGSRKVRIAYDQVVRESSGRIRYAYPLSTGSERATTIEDFSIQVRVTDTRSTPDEIETPRYAAKRQPEDRGFRVAFSAHHFVPANDFVVSYARPPADEAEVSAYVPSWGELKGAGLDGAARGAEGTGYFALRLRADLPLGLTPAHVRRDRAIVIDASHSQSKETLDAEAKLAAGIVQRLDGDEKFVVLACDSACSTFPPSGLAAVTDERVTELQRWLAGRAPSGSSDLAGALLDAARRLDADGSGQVVYVGDGSPTSGELSAATIADRVRGTLRARRIDLRFVGAGRAVDEVVTGALAQSLGATYEPLATGEPIESRISDVSMSLRSPVIRGATVELPPTFVDAYPRTLRNLRLGEQVVVVGRLSSQENGLLKLRGEIDGQPYALTRPVRWTAEAARQNPLVPRLWSLSRIADLESATDAPTIQQVIDLSKRYHVMSRYTSLLVLENDQMYAEYGIKRSAPATAGLPVDDTPGLTQAPGPVLAPQPSMGPRDDEALERRKEAPSQAEGKAEVAREKASPARASRSVAADESPPELPPSAPLGAAPPAATFAPAPASPPPAAAPAAKRSANAGPQAESLEIARDPLPDSDFSTPPTLDSLGNLGGLGSSAGVGSGMAAPRSQAQLGGLQVVGNLPQTLVERIVRQRLDRLRVCHEAGLRSNPMLAGRVSIRFVIGQQGEVLSSMDAGSDIADRSVVACAMVAIRQAVFPAPTSGFVTVTFSVVFRPTGNGPALVAYSPPQPSAVHRAADESWLTKGDDVLQRLRADVERTPDSRRKREDLVRGLLARGRFEEALGAAQKFVELDPDLAVARELLAYAAVTRDDPALAVLSVDTQTETDPSSLKWHVRGARAFEAMGDERRACAHWRSLAELSPQSEEYAYESLRCRARVLGDLDGALIDARRAIKPGKLLAALVPALEAGHPPAFAKTSAGAGQLEATVTCSSGERCPTVFIVSPIGNVFSPFTPTDSRSSLSSVAVAGLRDGTYTTLLSGGSPDARGSVELRGFGSMKTFAFARGGRQTVAATRITLPDTTARLMAMRGDGFLLLR